MSDTTAPTTTPVGHGQSTAYLLATVATNRARARRDELDNLVVEADRLGGEAPSKLQTWMRTAIDAAESRLTVNTGRGGVSSVEVLADALVFRPGSDRAAARLTQLTAAYATDWGVLIDPDELTVRVDAGFDAVGAQTRAEARAQHARAAAAIDVVAARPTLKNDKAVVMETLLRWHEHPEPTTAAARRQLGADLAAAGAEDSERTRAQFVADFLSSDVSEVDLLSSPVFVDPGTETRGRIPALLEVFARNPGIAPMISQEISVMTRTDQERVRATGKAIAAGEQVDTELWPGYVDRQAVTETLSDYARDMQELGAITTELAAGRLTGEDLQWLGRKSETMQDETSACIDRLAKTRDRLLDTARNGKGLAAIERAHLTAVVTDIDNGHTTRPELLWADEHTKADVDYSRHSQAASRLADTAREEINHRIAATNAVDPNSRAAVQLTMAVHTLGDTLRDVAGGAQSTGMGQKRGEYAEQRAHLGQALVQAHLPGPARGEIRDLLDNHARKAGQLGAAAVESPKQWEAKTTRVAAARDDAIAQEMAADAGRAKPPGEAPRTPDQQRACTTRIDTNLTAQQTLAPTGLRQLHEQEIGR